MSTSGLFLADDDVEQFRESGDYDHAAAGVMDRLGDELKDADGTATTVQLMGNAADALTTLAEDADDPTIVRERAEAESGAVARRSGKTKAKLVDLIEDATQDVLDHHRKEKLEDGEGLSVPQGVGLDTYLEDELIEIVRQESSDAVDEPVLRWRFRDGARVETSESAHHDYYALFKKLAAATDERLVPELASEQVEDELRDDEDIGGEAYAQMSLGPETRPWHTDATMWSRAISGLVQERTKTATVVGPRTDAWESIQARIRSGRAVRVLGDAVEHGALHVDKERGEVWVPTATIDNAADKVETSRRALQAELVERGVTSAELSGDRVSEAVSRGATATRFWRLDLSHEQVPEPDVILDEIVDPVDQLDAAGGDTEAATGGGSAATGGGSTETYGRRPIQRDGDANTDESKNEGDRDDGARSDGEQAGGDVATANGADSTSNGRGSE